MSTRPLSARQGDASVEGDGAGRPNDAELVARVRESDPRAFERMFRAYRAALTRLATRYSPSRAVADEVVQDVFLGIWRGRATWNPGNNLTAYLFAVTRHAALNAARRGRLEGRWMTSVGDPASAPATEVAVADGPDHIVEAAERTRALVAATQSLSSRVREAFLLRWRDGLSYAEIARVMGVSDKTVEKQLGIAFKTIRMALAPWIETQ